MELFLPDDEEDGPIVVGEMGLTARQYDKEQSDLGEAENLRGLEDRLMAQVTEIMADAMSFREIERGAEVVPNDWVQKLGYEKAQMRFRIAKAAWDSTKDSPVGLKLAKDAMVGMVKARATEKQGPRVLNATLIQTSTPIPMFPERIVER